MNKLRLVFYGSKNEVLNEQARSILKESGIHIDDEISDTGDTPYIRVGKMHHRGLQEIENFAATTRG